MTSSITVSVPTFVAILPAGVDSTLFAGNMDGLQSVGISAFPAIVNEGQVPAEFMNVVKPADVTERSLAKDAARFASEVPLELVAARALVGGATKGDRPLSEVGLSPFSGLGLATARKLGDDNSMLAITDGPSIPLPGDEPAAHGVLRLRTMEPIKTPTLAEIREMIEEARVPWRAADSLQILKMHLSKRDGLHFWVRVDDPNDPLFVKVPASAKRVMARYEVWHPTENPGGSADGWLVFTESTPFNTDGMIGSCSEHQAKRITYALEKVQVIDALTLQYIGVPESAKASIHAFRDIVVKIFEDAVNNKEDTRGVVDLNRASENLRKTMVTLGIFKDWFWWSYRKLRADREAARNIIIASAKTIFPAVDFDKHGGMQIVGAGNLVDK